MSAWYCRRCHWTGDAPSFSDASDVRVNGSGDLVMDRVHIAICPDCFHAVRRATPADLLDSAIADIATMRVA